MTKVLQRVEVTLRSFYIFNSKFGSKEGEEYKKILYYYPNDIELNTKIKDVGLSEAIIAFTGTFTDDDGQCKALHTQKTTQLFYQPEPGYWMVLVINVPKEIRLKDGIDVAEYKGTDVQDRIFRAILKQCYSMFRLLSGTFQIQLDTCVEGEEARKQLQLCLEQFFDKYLLSLKLASCDVMDINRSIQYLPLDKFLFLRTHNFINMIRATFPTITETIFLYNERVVCSGNIDPIDLYSLQEFITGTLIPRPMSTETSGSVLNRSSSTSSDIYRNGCFITGPENNERTVKPPKVFLAMTKTLQAYYLIIYRVLGAAICLFVNGQEQPENDFYMKLQLDVCSQLASLARDIEKSLTKPPQVNGKQTLVAATTSPITTTTNANTNEITPKYLYINEQSLKHMSNIAIDRHRPKVSHNIPANVMNIIADMVNDADERNTTDNSSSFEEVQVKTTNDFWIVKRRCNWRQYYVIIFNSKATLLDITQEAKRVFEHELINDVFFDK